MYLFSSSHRINEAADFKDHKIQVASCLISLKVEPLPALSVNLSGTPLIKIVLSHVLVRVNPYNPPHSSDLTHVFISHLHFPKMNNTEKVLIGECSCWLHDTHLIKGKMALWSACSYGSQTPTYEIFQLDF